MLSFCVLLGTMLFNLNAQTLPVFTNLAQVAVAASQNSGLIAILKLKATVFACSTNCDVLLLADESGGGLLELDGLNEDFQPGDRVEIEGGKCLLRMSEAGVYVCVAPMLNIDGLHAARTIDGQYFLEAGRHPVRLDWFNQFGAFELSCVGIEVNSAAPPSATAPLTESNLLHAVSAECFQGFWNQLPNFRLL